MRMHPVKLIRDKGIHIRAYIESVKIDNETGTCTFNLVGVNGYPNVKYIQRFTPENKPVDEN